MQSFILVECINRSRYNHGQEGQSPDVASKAKTVFGVKGEVAIACLLMILVEATLVSQISRAGVIFQSYRTG